MGTPNDIAAAAERIQRSKAGERHRTVYGFEDEKMDDFMYRMLENRHTADLQRLADAYLAANRNDDELTVTREWLMTFPGRVVDPSSKDTILIQIGGQEYVAIESDMTVAIQQCMYEDEGSQYIAIPISPKTRRQFRQLLAGLGIATEATP